MMRLRLSIRSGGPEIGKTAINGHQDLTRLDPERTNPHGAPSILVVAVDSSITDVVEIVLQHFDELPQSFRASLPKYFDAAMIEEEFRDFVNGMHNLRAGSALTADEIKEVAGPQDFLKSMAWGLREAADAEAIPASLNEIVTRDIIPQLASVRASYLTDPAARLRVQTWRDIALRQQFGSNAPEAGGINDGPEF